MTNGNCKRIFLKENGMAGVERAGYSSELYASGTEDDESVAPHSPTDSSEDSVEVKVNPISPRSKRKIVEPRKLNNSPFAPPPKKRMCLKITEEQRKGNREPFRPWNIAENKQESASKTLPSDTDNKLTVVNPFLLSPYIHHVNLSASPVSLTVPPFAQSLIVSQGPMKKEPQSPVRPASPAQPLSLVKKSGCDPRSSAKPPLEPSSNAIPVFPKPNVDPGPLRVPYHPPVVSMGPADTERVLQQSSEAFPNLSVPSPGSSSPYSRLHELKKSAIGARDFDSSGDSGIKKEQRNYKNMTRERRIEANARERTRVHTISAAFDTLRRAIPSYSHNQKLSKLSVLRIACSYIATLSNIVTEPDKTEETLEECVENVTRTIQREGKLRKKKDEGD